MKIKRQDIPSMTIEQFADAHNLVMEVHERRLPKGDPSRYYAHFEDCDIAGDGLLGEFGNAISLKRIVVGAYMPKSRVIDVPRLLPSYK